MRQLLFEPWIVLAAPTRLEGLDVLRHELAHYIAFQAIQHQPHWFAEGIACYFESAQFDGHGNFVVGKVPLDLIERVRRFGLMPASELLAPDADRGDIRFYGTAWLLVHHLMSEHGDAFVRYQSELVRGRGHEQAWAEAFPWLSSERVDVALREYALTGAYATFALPVELAPVTPRVRRLSRADEHALNAVLWTTCKRCPKEARRRRTEQSIAHALADDPTQVQATVMDIMGEDDAQRALAKARALSQAHPEHWLSWIALGFSLMRTEMLGTAVLTPDPVERAIQLAPGQPYTWLLAAARHAARGERVQALALAARARRLRPLALDLLLAHAELLAHFAECGALEELVRDGAQLVHAEAAPETWAQLDEFQRSCRRQPPAPGAPP